MSMFTSSMHMPNKKKMVPSARMHLPHMKLPVSNEKMLIYSAKVLISMSRMCYFLVCMNLRLYLLQVTLVFNFHFKCIMQMFLVLLADVHCLLCLSVNQLFVLSRQNALHFINFLQIGPNLLKFHQLKS